MIARWILLLVLAPGWLLPSGVSVPLCACRLVASEAGSCCAPVERHACCANADETETATEGQTVRRGGECHCSVEAPTHEPARVQHQPDTAALGALRLDVVRVPAAALTPAVARVIGPDRPRGPSPGRPNPAPLRL